MNSKRDSKNSPTTRSNSKLGRENSDQESELNGDRDSKTPKVRHSSKSPSQKSTSPNKSRPESNTKSIIRKLKIFIT